MQFFKLGTDIVKISRMQDDVEHYAHYLHPAEILVLNKINSSVRRQEFLAGRWVAKEAIRKAAGTDIAARLINIFISDNTCEVDYPGNALLTVSLSHEKNYAIACALAIFNKN